MQIAFTALVVLLLAVVAQALLAALYCWLRFQPYETRNWFWQRIHRPYTCRVEFVSTWLSLTVYLALSPCLLRRYGRWLADNFSEISALRWLLLLAVASLQWLAEVVPRGFFGFYYQYDYSTELPGGVVFLISIVGLRQANRPAVRAAGAELATKAAPLPYPPPRRPARPEPYPPPPTPPSPQ